MIDNSPQFLHNCRDILSNSIHFISLSNEIRTIEDFKTSLQNGRRDFSKLNLSGINFGYLDLSDCDFTNSNMKGCKFDGLLNNTVFYKSNLNTARFLSVEGNSVVFQDAEIEGAFFYNSKFTGCSFAGACMIAAHLEHTTFSYTSFCATSIVNGWVEDCTFIDSHFDRSSLHDQSTAILDHTQFDECSFINMSFDATEMDHSVFNECRFQKCDFIGVGVLKTNFLHSTFQESKIENDWRDPRSWRDTSWDGSCIEDLNLCTLKYLPLTFREDPKRFKKMPLNASLLLCEIVNKYLEDVRFGLVFYRDNIRQLSTLERKYLSSKFSATKLNDFYTLGLLKEIDDIEEKMTASSSFDEGQPTDKELSNKK
jgi:uncharacterized protein YjbI with pentapeptide repeats